MPGPFRGGGPRRSTSRKHLVDLSNQKRIEEYFISSNKDAGLSKAPSQTTNVQPPKHQVPGPPNGESSRRNASPDLTTHEKDNIRLQNELIIVKAQLASVERHSDEDLKRLRAENVQLRLRADQGQLTVEAKVKEQTARLEQQLKDVQGQLAKQVVRNRLTIQALESDHSIDLRKQREASEIKFQEQSRQQFREMSMILDRRFEAWKAYFLRGHPNPPELCNQSRMMLVAKRDELSATLSKYRNEFSEKKASLNRRDQQIRTWNQRSKQWGTERAKYEGRIAGLESWIAELDGLLLQARRQAATNWNMLKQCEGQYWNARKGWQEENARLRHLTSSNTGNGGKDGSGANAVVPSRVV